MNIKERKPIKYKKIWCILLITLSYVFAYFLPLLLLYNSMKDSFIRDYVIRKEISWSLIGFITISVVMTIMLVIKICIKLWKASASIGKSLTFGFIKIFIVLFIVYLLIKVYNFTFYVETNALKVLGSIRGFLDVGKQYLIIYSICLFLSTICNVIAIEIDKEYVRSLNWL